MQSDWLSAIERPGPLLAAAREFWTRERSRDLGAGDAMPRATEGLAWLLRSVTRHSEENSTDDDRFIEGAGAALGLLLIDSLGEGEHVTRDGLHRVRLGPRGFVDPFAAIEGALGSESVRDTLIEFVAHAEAEARGRKGVARAALRFERILARVRPELEVTSRFERRLWLGEDIEVDLGRAIDAAGDSSDALDRALQKLVDLLPGGADPAGVDASEARARLLPRVVESGPFEGRGLWLNPLAGGPVHIALVLAYDGRSRFVRADEPARWEMDPAAALHQAISNLAARSEKARFARVDTEEGSWVFSRSRDGLDSARVLLPGLFGVLSPDLGERVLVAVPHRDALIACEDRPALRRALRERAREDAARAPHAISDRIFELDARGLRVAN